MECTFEMEVLTRVQTECCQVSRESRARAVLCIKWKNNSWDSELVQCSADISLGITEDDDGGGGGDDDDDDD